MADRFPLILNTSANQIQEIASGDTLDLTGVGINNAGIITAASFSGPIVAGAGTSNIVAGIITATQIDLNGDIDVDGHTNLDNLSVAGVSTFAGNADFSSGVDVTGNIIATGEIQCKDISLIDTTPKITFFDTDNNPDYTISANSGSWRVTDSTSSAERLVVNSDGHVDVLGNLDVGAGVDVTGNVIASGNVSGVDGTFTGNVSIGGTLTYEDVTNIDSVGIITARAGINLTGGDITLGDSAGPHKLKFGADADFQLFHNGSNNYIDVAGNGHLYIRPKANFYIQDYTNGEVWIDGTLNGGVKLYNNGIKKFETDGNGITVQGNINMATDSTLQLGVGNDFKLFHNGTTNYIRSANGNIQIDNNSGVVNAKFIPGGASELYHNGSKKFETTSSGVTVTGTINFGSGMGSGLNSNGFNINFADSNGSQDMAKFGDSGDLKIYHQSNSSYIINATGNLNIGSNNEVRIKGGSDVAENMAVFKDNGAVELYHDAAKKVETTANGIIVYGPEGGGGLINLYADEGDDNADKYRLHSNPNGSFYLQNYTSGSWENNLAATGNGATELYYDNTPKLVTEQGGINVKSPGSDWNNIERTSNGYYGFAFRKEDGSSFNGYLGFTGGGSEINNTSAAQDLVIRSETNIILSKGYSTRLLKTDSNGAVSLYYGNGEKFYTSPNGISITGQAVATGNSAKFQAVESGGATVEIRCGGAEGYIGTQTGHKISFITSGNRTMTLLANKSLCIGLKGTTGNTSHNSTIGWEMSDGWTKGVFSGAVAGNTPWTLYNENSAYNRYMGYIKFDGGFANYSSNDINLCDERVKKDFAEVPSQWNNIKNIGFKHFRYQEDSSSEPLKIGVVAQQVETIYPDLVDEDWPQGDANPHTHEKNTGDFYKSVREEQLLMYSVKALQEAMAKIETLEAEVAALKGS